MLLLHHLEYLPLVKVFHFRDKKCRNFQALYFMHQLYLLFYLAFRERNLFFPLFHDDYMYIFFINWEYFLNLFLFNFAVMFGSLFLFIVRKMEHDYLIFFHSLDSQIFLFLLINDFLNNLFQNFIHIFVAMSAFFSLIFFFFLFLCCFSFYFETLKIG